MKSKEFWNKLFWDTFFHTLTKLTAASGRSGYDAHKWVEEIAKQIGVKIGEGWHFTPRWQIDRYSPRYVLGNDRLPPVVTQGLVERLWGLPFDRSVFDGNVALNEGLNLITTLVCGGSGDAASNANAQVGTGTSSTAADPTDSALTAGVWAGMDASYPTYGASQQMAFKGTYGTSTANQDWKEFAVRNKSTADIMLNRKVQDEGTKPSGQIWVLTVTFTGS